VKLTPQKFFYLMTGVNVVLLLAIFGAVYYGNGLIHKQSEKLIAAKTSNQVIERQQIQLTQAIKDVETYSELNDLSKAIVPQDKDQAKTVREITKIAQESGIALQQISFPSSNLGDFIPPPPPPPPSEDGSSGTATAPPVATTPPISQLTPAEGISGVFELQIVVTSLESQPVPYGNFVLFLEKLETNRRTAHVKDITVEPTGSGDNVTFVLTLNAYVKP